MPRKPPLYPHVPKSRNPRTPARRIREEEVVLKYLPDSPEAIARTVAGTGYTPRLEATFLAAIQRAKGARR